MNRIEKEISELSELNATAPLSLDAQYAINCRLINLVNDMWQYLKRCEPDLG